MKTNNLTLLKSIKKITEIKEVGLTDELKARIGPKLSQQALENSVHMNVYRMLYMSQGHKVVGYIVEPKLGDNLPCIIYNRGGSGDFGAIKLGQLFLDFSKFARAGYITIFTQYSGNAGSEGKDEMGGSDIEDVLELYNILKQYQRADVSRVGMYGGSRGGMMTYLALAKVEWLKAAVIVAGLNNIPGDKTFRPEMKDHYIKMFGRSMKEKKKRSAIYWVDKLPKNVPILLMHGTSDWRVNPLDSLHMAEKMYEQKIPYRLVMFEGADHGLFEYKQEANEMAIKWMDGYVKNGETLPNLEPHGD